VTVPLPLDLRERIARRFCATHGGTAVVCEIGYAAADAAIAELRVGGLSMDDVLTIGVMTEEPAEVTP
jgi:hypothetical protein